MRDLETRLDALEAALRPIAKSRTITPADLRVRPVDRAGVRREAEDVVRELISAYASGDDAVRQDLRDVLALRPSFRWAAPVSAAAGPDPTARFRANLLWISLCDGDPDPRDHILAIGALTRDARAAGVDVAPIVAEVAALSSDVDKYGFGSARTLVRAALRG